MKTKFIKTGVCICALSAIFFSCKKDTAETITNLGINSKSTIKTNSVADLHEYRDDPLDRSSFYY